MKIKRSFLNSIVRQSINESVRRDKKRHIHEEVARDKSVLFDIADELKDRLGESALLDEIMKGMDVDQLYDSLEFIDSRHDYGVFERYESEKKDFEDEDEFDDGDDPFECYNY